MRSLVNKCYFAVIKANKPSKRNHQDLCIQHINACRQLLKIGKKSTSLLQENCKQYLQERSLQRANVINSKEIFRRWEEIRPIESEVNVLSFSSELNAQEIKYINNVAEFWGNFLLKQAQNENDGNKTNQQLETSLQDYHKTLNYLIYLMTPNQYNLILFVRIHTALHDLRLIKQKNQSQLRYVIDKILALPSISEPSIVKLLYFTSRDHLSYIYHEKSKEFTDYIYSQINISQLMALKNPSLIKNLIYSLIKNSQPPMDLVMSVAKVLESKASIPIKLRTFILLSQLFIINKNNVKNPQYLNALKQITSQPTIDNWVELSRLFYLMGAWIDQFWIPYFKFMSKDSNYLKVRKQHHYVINDLLSEGEGAVEVQKQAEIFRKLLYSNGYDIKDFDFRKQHQQHYGKKVASKFSCELHVANSLRLISMEQVLTEVAVKYFLVDVMINKKVIIQINNISHYRIINGEWRLNLKSYFRERVLKKAGYVCKNLRVEDYTNSNYSMLQEIYKIVEETKDLKDKKKNKQQAILSD